MQAAMAAPLAAEVATTAEEAKVARRAVALWAGEARAKVALVEVTMVASAVVVARAAVGMEEVMAMAVGR